MSAPKLQFNFLPEYLQNSLIHMMFGQRPYSQSALHSALRTPCAESILNSLARKEIDPEDYSAVWEAVLNSRSYRINEQFEDEGACEMRSRATEVTESYNGLFEFFGLQLEDNIAFDWGWCPALIDAIVQFYGRLTGTSSWQATLVIGLKAMQEATGVNGPDLSSLRYDWHYGPRKIEEGDVVECLADEAEFYGVYGRELSGLGCWVADVKNKPDARLLTAALARIYPG